MMKILKHEKGEVIVEKLEDGKNKISVNLFNKGFMPHNTAITSYPVELIGKILQVKGPAYLCDEILRDEAGRLNEILKYGILSYVSKENFKNKRLLDFGCGSGASTMILKRMLPDVKVVGIDLKNSSLSISKARAKYYCFNSIEFLQSPDTCSLPTGICEFDFINLTGVYEHLLPNERKELLPKIYNHLKPGGILFFNETPNRWFPIEFHTTGGLPFINYLPDKLALSYIDRFSLRKKRNHNWDALLKNGIRGGSVKEILSILNDHQLKPILLIPSRLGIKDRIDLWYKTSTKTKFAKLKKVTFFSMKIIKKINNFICLPMLSLAIRKSEGMESQLDGLVPK